jgi:tetratricopeptide (TPR) repeat protein
MPLLALSVKEDPHNDRNAFYYARELFFNNDLQEAYKEFNRHLSLPSARWKAERAASMRYIAKCEPNQAEPWLKKAISEDPGRREAIVELALNYYFNYEWKKCFETALTAIFIKEKPLDYLCEDFAWGALPYDLLAISSYNLNNKHDAIKYQMLALEIEPDNKRFIANLEHFESMED